MFDPDINLDPFSPTMRPQPCHKCLPGRLFIESLGERRRVWCDECDWSQLYDASGPMAKVVMRPVEKKFNSRPGRPKKVKKNEPL